MADAAVAVAADAEEEEDVVAQAAAAEEAPAAVLQRAAVREVRAGEVLRAVRHGPVAAAAPHAVPLRAPRPRVGRRPLAEEAVAPVEPQQGGRRAQDVAEPGKDRWRKPAVQVAPVQRREARQPVSNFAEDKDVERA